MTGNKCLLRPAPSLRLAALALALAGPAAPAEKPKLSLKASPAIGTKSTVFLFQAVLTGGEEGEGLYCLTTEWTWEEQADSSLNEAECPPFKPGETKIERRFTEEQSFHRPGPHVVKVALRKGEKEIASAGVTVRVRDVP
jgi:hypothetical protein